MVCCPKSIAHRSTVQKGTTQNIGFAYHSKLCVSTLSWDNRPYPRRVKTIPHALNPAWHQLRSHVVHRSPPTPFAQPTNPHVPAKISVCRSDQPVFRGLYKTEVAVKTNETNTSMLPPLVQWGYNTIHLPPAGLGGRKFVFSIGWLHGNGCIRKELTYPGGRRCAQQICPTGDHVWTLPQLWEGPQ